MDGTGNLYIADSRNHNIRRVDASGTITTIAGTGSRGYNGDGGPAIQAQLNYPTGVAVDATGNLYIADSGNHRTRRVDARGVITTIAGTGSGGYSGDNGPAAQAQLARPEGMAIDRAGNLYIADFGNDRIRRVDARGVITTIAGTGERGYSGDNGPAAQAQLAFPRGVTVDGVGNLYIAEYGNHRIRQVDARGIITTIAGIAYHGLAGSYFGDGGPAIEAGLNFPQGVAVDGAGNVYIADTSNNRIRRVDARGGITTIAGIGDNGFSGDGGLAVQARIAEPFDVAVDGAGNLYIAEYGNRRIRVLRQTSSLPPPTRLKATPVSSSRIDLAWQDNSDNETGFRVQHRLNGTDDWVTVGSTAANVHRLVG